MVNIDRTGATLRTGIPIQFFDKNIRSALRNEGIFVLLALSIIGEYTTLIRQKTGIVTRRANTASYVGDGSTQGS